MPDIPDMFTVSRKRLKSAYGTVITVLHHVQTFCLHLLAVFHVPECHCMACLLEMCKHIIPEKLSVPARISDCSI